MFGHQPLVVYLCVSECICVTMAVDNFVFRIIKAKLWEISSDTHQLQLIKLHHFKLERFKSI